MYRGLFKYLFAYSGLVLSSHAYGQNCESMLTRAVTDMNRIYVTAETEVTKRELKKELDKVKAELRNSLMETMSEEILLEVTTSTTMAAMEAEGIFESTYISETEIVSNVSLSEGEAKFCVDEKNRVVYGSYSLNRKQTALKALKDCENRLLRLVAEVRHEQESSDRADVDGYNATYEKIKRDAKVVTYLDLLSDMTLLNDQFREFNVVFSDFKQTSDNRSYDMELREVETRLGDGDYRGALNGLRQLRHTYPNRKELPTMIEDNERRYKVDIVRKVRTFEALNKYADALTYMYRYCETVNCSIADYRRIEDLRAAYFKDELTKFDRALGDGQKSAATTGITTLKSLAGVNPKSYQMANERYNTFLVKLELESVELALHREHYKVAFAKIKSIETKYGSNYDELQSLKRTTGQKLLRSEVKLEKQKRRKLYSLGIGGSVFSNQIETVKNIDKQFQTLTFAYSVGLYKKFNYTDSWDSSFPKKSDLIGIRFRMWDHRSTLTVHSESDLTFTKPYRYDAELAVDGTAFHAFHYDFGVLFEDRQIVDNLIYTGELGLKIPLWSFSVQMNARTEIRDREPIYMLSGGAYVNLDFWRKFKKKERRDIKAKLGV